MWVLRKIYFTIFLIIIFSGCAQKTVDSTVITNKKEDIKDEKVKKEVKKYKYCNKHKKIMNHALKYILNEFQQGYLNQDDIVGVKAQLYLIEKDSPTIFATNINAAQNSYKKQYYLAKKNGCNISKYRVFPINRVKYLVEKLEKKIKENENAK